MPYSYLISKFLNLLKKETENVPGEGTVRARVDFKATSASIHTR